MTNDIAFKLGEFKLPSFYGSATWRPNIETFELYRFFKWGYPQRVKHYDEEDWTQSFSGELDTSKFTSDELKLKYIQGRLSSYSVKITESSIEIGYANSYNLRDLVSVWADELLRNKFGGVKTWKIKKGEIFGTTPGTPWVRIEGDSELIKFLTGTDNENN